MKPLRIGVDARELLGARTGVGRYLGELLRRWTARDDCERRRFILYAPEPLSLEFPAGVVDQRVIGRGRGTWWEQTWLRRAVTADRPDVFFAPAYTAPLGSGLPLAVTIHDVSFVAHPEWFRPREGLRRRWLTRRAAHSASVIFTDSEFSRAEIVRRLRVNPSRVEVIPPGIRGTVPLSAPVRGTVPLSAGAADGIGPLLRERADQTREGVPKAGVTGQERGTVPLSGPLVLYVGSIFNRRRLPDLIAAFAALVSDVPDARLVIVGDDRSWPPQDLREVANSHAILDHVQFLRYIPDDALADLYAGASVFAFLSEYEGFGLTPLEALAARVPIVVLDTPVAREVYGDAAQFVQRGDIPATAAALRALLTSPEAVAAQLARAPAVLARYSWEAAADRTLQHIERIAGR